MVRRRDLLKATGAGFATLAAPRLGWAEKTNKLVFVPTSDLAILDPVITGARPTRNHAYLVFDTLYGIDTDGPATDDRGSPGRGRWSDLDAEVA